jgi:predicted Zn-dependent protease
MFFSLKISRLNSLTIAIILLLAVACATVPITGRKTLNLIPGTQINTMSFGQYDEFLKANQLSTDQTKSAMVKRVGRNIQFAVEAYFAQENMSSYLTDYRWDFNLVEDDLVNAWCMPGGKVVVYSGLLPIAQDEDGLAVVMGHEIAHAIANHGNERMSQGLLVQMGGLALSQAIKNKPKETQNLFMTAFGVGTTVGAMLPFSRLHESEADRLGLIFMAMAGYDPHAAVPFWQRMSEGKSGGQPEFLSTHPSGETRISNIKKTIPEAMRYSKRRKKK